MDAFLLIAHGCDAYEVAEMYGHSPRSVHDWINGVNRNGLQYLMDDKKPGRPTKLLQEQIEQISNDVHKSPAKLGYDQAGWNGKMLSEHIHKQFGIELKIRRCQELFHDLGFSYKRSHKMVFGSKKM